MSAPLSEQQLAAIRAREAAAFAGPWYTDSLAEHDGSTSIGVATGGDTWIVELGDLDPADAEFIAHARTDVPALLDALERRTTLLRSVQKIARQRMAEAKGREAYGKRLKAEVEQLRADLAAAEQDKQALAAGWERARARVAGLETAPLAWAEKLDAKSLDNLLITLSQAADHEPMSGAIDQIHEVLAGFRQAVEGGAS